MPSKTKINNTLYTISNGKTRINGTNYKISGGKVLSNGSKYTISFGYKWAKYSCTYKSNLWYAKSIRVYGTISPSDFVSSDGRYLDLYSESKAYVRTNSYYYGTIYYDFRTVLNREKEYNCTDYVDGYQTPTGLYRFGYHDSEEVERFVYGYGIITSDCDFWRVYGEEYRYDMQTTDGYYINNFISYVYSTSPTQYPDCGPSGDYFYIRE